MKSPITHAALILLALSTCLPGCNEPKGDYIAASSISQKGFALNGNAMRKIQGREIRVWGYVDPGNLYGDEGAKAILQEWWSGYGPSAPTWRFNLKAHANDKTGQSFPVRLPNDQGRDDLLKMFLRDARAQRPTKVFVKGKLFTFDAPTNAAVLTGLYMELASSQSIKPGFPEEN